MNTKPPIESWASDAQARCLRVDLADGRSLLLPFDQFMFAEIRQDAPEQEIRAIFTTHELTVRGHSLRRIAIAMQRMELSLLTTRSPSARSAVPDGQPVIREIVALDLKNSGSPETEPSTE